MAVMEMKIYNPADNGFLQKIEWNFEELKGMITTASQDYATMVYDDSSIKTAKADRAKLNKFVDALNGKRTEIRKQLLKPDEQFGKEVKELTGIVQAAITNIDSQVKAYEERLREEKRQKCREIYDECIEDLEDILPFEKVYKPSYANASTTLKSIKEEMKSVIQKVTEGLAIINEVESDYAGDMKKIFLETYDLSAAMAERNRLEEAERRRKEYIAQQEKIRAEREEREKAQAAAVMAAGRASVPVPQPEPVAQRPAQNVETVEEPVNIVDFRVKATAKQLQALKLFLVENKIPFGPIPKKEGN